MTKVGILHENARISRRFWRKLISLRSILADYKCIRRFVCIYAHQSFLSIQYVHGDLCKHLGIDSSTDLDGRYSKLFLNAYINRHVHAKYLKMI